MANIKEINYEENEEVVFFILPKEKAQLATQAIASNFGYKSKIVDVKASNPGVLIDNPESPEKFTKRMVVEWVEGQTKAYLERKAREEQEINGTLNVKI